MPPTMLYRLAGQAGVLTGVLLLFNDARRVGLVPENTFTHGIAPVAAFLAGFALIGLYLRQRDRAGTVGLWGFALNLVGLTGLAAIEFTLHYVFPLLDTATRDSLVDGRTGTGFLIISVIFIAGVLLFGAATWRAGLFPAWAAALYVVGFVPTALRAVLPEAVVSVAFVVGSAAVIWMSAVLWRTSDDVVLRAGRVLGEPSNVQ